MSIRYRLILSYMAMIIVPIILFIVAALLMAIVFLGEIREVSNLLPQSHNYHKTVHEDTKLFYELKKMSIVDPERLLDESYLNKLESNLNEIEASIVISKNGDLWYNSDKANSISSQDLPDFGYPSSDNNIEKLGEKTYSFRHHDFYLSDGSEASLFLLKDASPLVRLTHTLYPLLFVICILILIITNGFLTYSVSKSIISPIEKLKNAVQRIKDGDLDHSLQVSKRDEIGELTVAFEDMRKKLKESSVIQKQYEENRKELIAHISHDLKTPITAIKGYVEGIRDGVANEPDKHERYIHTIYQRANDMDKLIDELFLYSKLDLKKVPFSFENVDLKSYLLDYIEELAFDLEKTGTEIDFHFSKDKSYLVKADPGKLKRVFSNIIDNSLKYMNKETGRVEIKISQDPDYVMIQIADNGPGIPKESLPFIFNQFYRAEQSRNTSTGGSGLGLAIARMIVEEHEGKISVESSSKTGTEMKISLKRVH